MIGIYQIINKVNGNSYIGKSIRIEERWYDHKNWAFNERSKKYNYPLYKAFRKYGIHNFDFIVLEECLEEELTKKEIYWFNKLNHQYCLTNPNYSSFAQTPEIRKKISESLIGRKHSKERIEKMSEAMKGSKNPNAVGVIGTNKKTKEKISFNALTEAADFLIEKGITTSNRRTASKNISRALQGHRLSAYGFTWKEKN